MLLVVFLRRFLFVLLISFPQNAALPLLAAPARTWKQMIANMNTLASTAAAASAQIHLGSALPVCWTQPPMDPDSGSQRIQPFALLKAVAVRVSNGKTNFHFCGWLSSSIFRCLFVHHLSHIGDITTYLLRKFQRSSKDVPKKLKKVPKKFQRSSEEFQRSSKEVPKSSKEFPKKFQRSYKEGHMSLGLLFVCQK